MSELTCAGCGRLGLTRADFHAFRRRARGVTSRCRSCRREVYYAKRYPDTICASCQYHRPLDSDGVCRRCHEETGLRECRGCCRLLPALMAFYGRATTCKECSKVLKPVPKPAINTT